MPNIMIYINSVNKEQLAKEPNKSGLVNALLEKYYAGGKTGQPMVVTSVPAQTVPDDDPATFVEASVEEFPPEASGDPRLCKHHMLKGTCGFDSCQ